jgi:hypothetical protein
VTREPIHLFVTRDPLLVTSLTFVCTVLRGSDQKANQGKAREGANKATYHAMNDLSFSQTTNSTTTSSSPSVSLFPDDPDDATRGGSKQNSRFTSICDVLGAFLYLGRRGERVRVVARVVVRLETCWLNPPQGGLDSLRVCCARVMPRGRDWFDGILP